MRVLHIFSSVILFSFFAYMGCDSGSDDPSITETERVKTLLIGDAAIGTTWNIQSVTVGEVDYTDEFSGLSLTFSDGGVTAENGRAVFESTDSWSFNDESATSFTTGLGLNVTIQGITQNSLVLRFVLDETILGRQDAVAGENIFTFTR
ncbi:hypothetical protein [Fulvivirga lutea]|uniref:Lipocalin-like domain-containing protein n=1 Tax=Fulvivirga lutea TaxID=2810512 RepID=A0A975A1N7_9BACT|nr:hypothetical protein [Fulvivirga lutea]QSE97722.1 hypothetical protein JR347_01140 [Fulvivirga lutea]